MALGSAGVSSSRPGKSELEGWINFLSNPQEYAGRLAELKSAETAASEALAKLARGRDIEKLHAEALEAKDRATRELDEAKRQIESSRARLREETEAGRESMRQLRAQCEADCRAKEAAAAAASKAATDSVAMANSLLAEAEKDRKAAAEAKAAGEALRDEWLARKSRMEAAWRG